MINRILIRSKVVQIAYSYFLTKDKTVMEAEKELFFSFEKSYELSLIHISEPTRQAEISYAVFCLKKKKKKKGKEKKK